MGPARIAIPTLFLDAPLERRCSCYAPPPWLPTFLGRLRTPGCAPPCCCGMRPKMRTADRRSTLPDLRPRQSQTGETTTLTDAAGKPVPVVAVWQRAEGRDTLLLARDLQPGTKLLSLHRRSARQQSWTPKTSLLLETRAAHPATASTNRSRSAGTLCSRRLERRGCPPAGRRLRGEDLLPRKTPFGENRSTTYSHYSRLSRADHQRRWKYSPNSTNASFVLVERSAFRRLDRCARHPPTATPRVLRSKRLPASSAEPVKLDYYQVKGSGEANPPIMSPRLETGASGQRRVGGGAGGAPSCIRVRDHASEKLRRRRTAPPCRRRTIESQRPTWVSAARTCTRFTANWDPADLAGATVEWHFDDGAVFAPVPNDRSA